MKTNRSGASQTGSPVSLYSPARLYPVAIHATECHYAVEIALCNQHLLHNEQLERVKEKKQAVYSLFECSDPARQLLILTERQSVRGCRAVTSTVTLTYLFAFPQMPRSSAATDYGNKRVRASVQQQHALDPSVRQRPWLLSLGCAAAVQWGGFDPVVRDHTLLCLEQ